MHEIDPPNARALKLPETAIHRTAAGGPLRQQRILYLMHVDWRWIKQRPHFLAEVLRATHEVRVMDRWLGPRAGGLTQNRTKVSITHLLPLPWLDGQLGEVLVETQRAWVALVANRFQPTAVWITHPLLYQVVPTTPKGLPLIYDCMDDVLGFKAGSSRTRRVQRLEQEVVLQSALILSSSAALREALIKRYGSACGTKTAVVRNAVSAEVVSTLARGAGTDPLPSPGRLTRIAYFGTVGEWFNWDLIVAAVNEVANLEVHVYGPILRSRAPVHDRIVYHGSVPHHDLPRIATSGYHAYVMPFEVSPLIEAVDPVKLYEYIAIGGETIAVRYAEVERLESMIHLYRSPAEFVHLLRQLTEGTLIRKNTAERRTAFLSANTWDIRCHQVNDLLAALRC